MDMQQAISIMAVVYYFVALFVCFKWVFDEEPIVPRMMLSIISPYIIPIVVIVFGTPLVLPVYMLLYVFGII